MPSIGNPSAKFSVLERLYFAAGAVLLIGGVYEYIIRWQRNEAAYSTMKAIYTALCVYEEKHGEFPAIAKKENSQGPAGSWRVAILETIESSPAAKEAASEYSLATSWDSPENKRTMEKWLKSNEQLAQAAHYARFLAVHDEDHPFWGKRNRDLARSQRQPIVVMLWGADPERWARPDMLIRRGGSFFLNDATGSGVAVEVDGQLALFSDSSVEPLRLKSHSGPGPND